MNAGLKAAVEWSDIQMSPLLLLGMLLHTTDVLKLNTSISTLRITSIIISTTEGHYGVESISGNELIK